MAEPAVKPGSDGVREASVGELVSYAVKDLAQLVKCELDLAKLELKADMRRVGISGALLGMAAFVGCLVLVLLCFAFAYGLIALGIWPWAAFLIVAGTCILLAGLARPDRGDKDAQAQRPEADQADRSGRPRAAQARRWRGRPARIRSRVRPCPATAARRYSSKVPGRIGR